MSRDSSSSEADNEISEFIIDPVDRAGEMDPSVESQAPKKRGRKRIPEQWTGIINLERDDVSRIKIRDLATDLLFLDGIPDPPRRTQGNQWEPIFLSKNWLKDREEIVLDDFRLRAE